MKRSLCFLFHTKSKPNQTKPNSHKTHTIKNHFYSIYNLFFLFTSCSSIFSIISSVIASTMRAEAAIALYLSSGKMNGINGTNLFSRKCRFSLKSRFGRVFDASKSLSNFSFAVLAFVPRSIQQQQLLHISSRLTRLEQTVFSSDRFVLILLGKTSIKSV